MITNVLLSGILVLVGVLCYGLYRVAKMGKELLGLLNQVHLRLVSVNDHADDLVRRSQEERKLAGKTWVPGETEQARLEKGLRGEAVQRQWGASPGLRRFAP